MAKVVVAAFGTRGDVAPLMGIGLRLRQAGHEVVLTAPSQFGELITGCGLRHLPHDVELGLDADADLSEANPLRLVLKLLSPSGMRATGEALLAALRDEPADVLLLSPFAELAGHPLAEARGIPSMGVRLQPLSTTAEFPPAVLGSWSAGPLLNRSAGHLATAAFDRLYASTVAGFRDRLGLPTVSARALRRRRTEAGWPILYGFSPNVVPRPADWRPGLDVVGYWWPPRPPEWRAPDRVLAFLESGPPPVCVGFGSLVMTKSESARMSDLVVAALRKVGARGVIQSGSVGLNVVEADGVLPIGDIPHDWLLDRMAAVVHACGAGTTAAGLRAGIPAIAIPGPGGDQPFWAKRLRELGVSAATLSRRTLTADRLAAAIDTALTDAACRADAGLLAAQIAEEDGAGRVVTTVERLAH